MSVFYFSIQIFHFTELHSFSRLWQRLYLSEMESWALWSMIFSSCNRLCNSGNSWVSGCSSANCVCRCHASEDLTSNWSLTANLITQPASRFRRRHQLSYWWKLIKEQESRIRFECSAADVTGNFIHQRRHSTVSWPLYDRKTNGRAFSQNLLELNCCQGLPLFFIVRLSSLTFIALKKKF